MFLYYAELMNFDLDPKIENLFQLLCSEKCKTYRRSNE
jgi:hypothetical protein